MGNPHFSVDRIMEIVILSLAPNADIDGICERYGIQKSALRNWKEKFLEGARAALSSKSRDTSEIRKKLEDSRKALKDLISGESQEAEKEKEKEREKKRHLLSDD